MPNPPDQPAASRPLRAWHGRALGVLLLFLVNAAVYGPTLAHGFVWDDHEQVVDNPLLRDWRSFPAFWTSDILSLSRAGQARSNYYRPLFYTQYLAYYQAFGLNAAAWHTLAILHHFAACLAVWAFLCRLRLGREVALSAAVLFAVHPAHGESVSWIAAAFNDPPAASFLLLALLCFVEWMRAGRARHAALAAAGFAVALCLKESALCGLLLAPLVAWYVARQDHLPPAQARARALIAYAPWAGLTVLYFLVRARAVLDPFGLSPGTPSLRSLLPTFPVLGLFYVRLLLWPWGLSPSYPLRYLTRWDAPAPLIAVALLAGLGAAAYLATRGRPVLRFAALWTVLAMLPALNVFSFREYYLVHQRYLYLSVMGLGLAVAWVLAAAVPRPVLRRAMVAALAVVWGASNVYHDRFWASDTALWRRVGEVDPGNPAAFDWLGQRAKEAGDIDGAEALFRRSMAADPRSPLGARNLAALLHVRRGNPAAALPYYRQALARFEALEPRYHDEHQSALIGYAVCLEATGSHDEALRVLLEVARTPPRPALAYRNAAVLLQRDGRDEELEALLLEGIGWHPEDPVLPRMLAESRRASGPAAR